MLNNDLARCLLHVHHIRPTDLLLRFCRQPGAFGLVCLRSSERAARLWPLGPSSVSESPRQAALVSHCYCSTSSGLSSVSPRFTFSPLGEGQAPSRGGNRGTILPVRGGGVVLKARSSTAGARGGHPRTPPRDHPGDYLDALLHYIDPFCLFAYRSRTLPYPLSCLWGALLSPLSPVRISPG